MQGETASMNDSNEVEKNEKQQFISTLDQYLNERERTILLLRFGLIDGVIHTLQEIGEMFSISRERVRQIEARAKQKLKQHVQQQLFKDTDVSHTYVCKYPCPRIPPQSFIHFFSSSRFIRLRKRKSTRPRDKE